MDPRGVQGCVRLARREKGERLAPVAFLYVIIDNSCTVNHASLTTITSKSAVGRTNRIIPYKLPSVVFIDIINIGVHMLPH